jgi:hypothetical protein
LGLQINRVWDWLLGSVFGQEKDFALSSKRRNALTASQCALLRCIVDFMNDQLMQTSHEKKCVAYYVFVNILQRIPDSVAAKGFNMNVVLNNLLLVSVLRSKVLRIPSHFV